MFNQEHRGSTYVPDFSFRGGQMFQFNQDVTINAKCLFHQDVTMDTEYVCV